MLESIRACPEYRKTAFYNNNTLTIREIYNERKHLREVTDSLKNELKAKMDDYEKEHNKSSFQQLVLFTAVITFVITAATSATSAQFDVRTLSSIGLILIIFVTTASLFNDKPNKFLLDYRIYILMIFILSIILINFSPAINNYSNSKKCLLNCNVVIEIPNTPFVKLDK
ncbi:hypothetical protein MACH09_41550 [Vibrio sp. MACH09]|uniref:hypothetical protein n=1 Tax=Vibrio sp. MACH09 TaxID=3025122 RepID=UPI0027947545|nr:hypothetical protein [Vibrio sp. MACH09]GLO63647.1 hypothetical protein MACH09_41550 [Vibrio sp. MACH09]